MLDQELVPRDLGEPIDRRTVAHVREMEEKLLKFCRDHLDELAGG